MKRFIILFILILSAAGVYAQTYFPYGIVVGAKRASAIGAGSIIATIDSVGVDGSSNYKLYNGSTEVSANKVKGFTPAAGSLTLSGDDAITLTTTAATSVTMPTSGTLATTQNINDTLAAGESLSAITPFYVDTIPLFTAGYGWGAATDTTGIDITADFGGWYNDGSDTVQMAKVIGIVKNSKNASTVTINIYWDANYYDATPADSAFTAGLAVSSTTAGTSTTTFLEAKIPPGMWVWVKPCRSLGTTGTKPSKLRLSVSGYKIPKY